MAEVKQEPEVTFEYCVLCSKNFSSQQEYLSDQENAFESVKACFSIPFSPEIDGAVCPSCRQRLTKAQRLKQFISDTLIKFNSVYSSRPEAGPSEEESPRYIKPDVGVIKSEPSRQKHVQHPPCDDNGFKRDAENNSTLNNRPIKEKIICNVCSKEFPTMYKLKVHMVYHGDVRNHKCDVCFKAFKTNSDLKKHKISHTDERNFECHLCHKALKTKRNLREHMTCHGDERKYKCDICFKSFKLASYLRVHMKSHRAKQNYSCCYCSRIFKDATSLRMHTDEPRDDVNLKCCKCFEEFKYKWAFEAHMRFHKLEQQQTTKDEQRRMRKKAKRKSMRNKRKAMMLKQQNMENEQDTIQLGWTVRVNLVRLEDLEQVIARGSTHKLTYTLTQSDILFLKSNEAERTRPVFDADTRPDSDTETTKCAVCSESFPNRDALLDHLSVVHGDSEQFVCGFCCQVFRRKGWLRAHMRDHTVKRLFDDDLYSKAFRHTGGYFVCNICSRRFRRQRQVREHLISHTELRKFKCGVCSRAFKTGNQLRDHTIFHSYVRIIKCSVCSKQFKKTRDANAHLASHRRRARLKMLPP